MVGRLQKWKGMHTLIAALPHCANATWIFTVSSSAGSTRTRREYETFLKEQVAKLGLEDCVRLVGLQTTRKSGCRQWMSVSMRRRMTFASSLSKAMALGKPCRGSTGRPAEIITPEVNGLLSP